jgi:hypothetical protein
MKKPTFIAHCACGRAEFEAIGKPFATISCYCDDCQAAGKLIDAMPGHSGLEADGGTVSVLFRKDLVRRGRGGELLVEHKLRPSSHAARLLASCCNSNLATVFDNWVPMAALRTFSVNVDSVQPEKCINTRYAPDPSKLARDLPQAARVPASLLFKVLLAGVELALQRIPGGDGRVT